MVVHVDLNSTDKFINELKKYKLKNVTELKYTLEKYFLEHFGGEVNGTSEEK